MMSLDKFIETMDHEFGEIGITLSAYGYKVDSDANGLKKQCRLNQLKSVDYIYPKNSKFPLIEFSDIARQYENIKNDSDKIANCDLDCKTKKRIIKDRNKIIHSELVQKFKDTITLINNLHIYVTDIPDDLQNNSLPYYVVVAPFNAKIETEKKRGVSQIF